MLENKKRATRRLLLIGALGLTASLAMVPQAFAGSKGYVKAASGEVWMTSGSCLQSANESPKKMAQCGDDMGEKMATAAPAMKDTTMKSAPMPMMAPAVYCDTTIYFDYDRSALKANMKRMLDALASRVKASPESEKVSIVGHTDSRGTEAYNMGLSNRRAKAVAGYLSKKGIKAVSVTGKGESSPASRLAAENRRTEVSCK